MRRLFGHALILAVALPLAILAQISVLGDVRVLYGTPDLALIVLVIYATVVGPECGAVAGFGAGLVIDLASRHAMGREALVLTATAYLAGRLGELLNGRRLGLAISIVGVSACVARLLDGAVAFVLGQSDAIRIAFSPALLSSPALDVLIALALAPLVRLLLGTTVPQRSVRFEPEDLRREHEETDAAALV